MTPEEQNKLKGIAQDIEAVVDKIRREPTTRSALLDMLLRSAQVLRKLAEGSAD